jgi:hypothetical protein
MTRDPDTTALTRPVDHAEVASFRARENTNWRWNDQSGLATGGAIVVGSLFGLLPLAIVGLLDLTERSEAVPDLARFAPPIVVVVSIAWVVLVRRGAWAAWERRLRLGGFATANRLTFREASDVADHAGAVFHFGFGGERFAFFQSLEGPPSEYGSYRWSTMVGRQTTTHVIGYVAIRLERSLPTIVLESGKAPGVFTMDRFARVRKPGRTVSLGRGLLLSCEPRFEKAARRVFAADVVGLLLDDVPRIEVEVVEDQLFLYAGTTFDWLQPATWDRLVVVRELLRDRLDAAFPDPVV